MVESMTNFLFWLLAVGCGCWLLAVGCWLLAFGCWLLAAVAVAVVVVVAVVAVVAAVVVVAVVAVVVVVVIGFLQTSVPDWFSTNEFGETRRL